MKFAATYIPVEKPSRAGLGSIVLEKIAVISPMFRHVLSYSLKRPCDERHGLSDGVLDHFHAHGFSPVKLVTSPIASTTYWTNLKSEHGQYSAYYHASALPILRCEEYSSCRPRLTPYPIYASVIKEGFAYLVRPHNVTYM